MSKLMLKCPHCGYSKDVQRDLIPHEEVRLKCPKCAESFVFNVKEAERAALAEAEAEAAAAPPAAPAPPAAEYDDDLEEKVRAVCPACGFFRKISAGLIPPEGKRMKCPRCKESFTVGGPEGAVEEPPTRPSAPAGEAYPSTLPVEEQAAPPEMPETDYGTHPLGELSGHLGEPIADELEEAEPIETASPEFDEDNIFGGEYAPPAEEPFPPEPEDVPELGEAGLGDLSGHIGAPMVPEEVPSEKYHPARNIPQADVTRPAEKGYQVSLPEDLLEAAESVPEEEIEVVPRSGETSAGEAAQEEPAVTYKSGKAQRLRAKEGHGFAVRTDFNEFLKSPPPRPAREEFEGPEVERVGASPAGEERDYLITVGELFRDSWTLLRSRASTFIPLMLVCPLFIFLSMGISYGISYLFSTLAPESAYSIQTAGFAFGAFFSVYLLSWWSAAFVKAVSDDTIKSAESFSLTKPVAGAFMWLFIINLLVVAGGYLLFVIPGVLMSVWFSFSYFLLVSENERGLSAMIMSREYVRGFWGGVLWRLAVVWLIPSALVLFEYRLGIIYLFYLPFPVAYTYLLYRDLRDIKGRLRVRPTSGSKAKYVAIGLLGLSTPFIVVAALFYGGGLGKLDESYGTDLRTLLAGLTGERSDVRNTYDEYRKALLEGDYNTFAGCMTEEYLTRLGSRSDNIVKYKQSVSPARPVEISEIDFDNLNARLSLISVHDDGVMTGIAVMTKRLGKWYVDKEDWNLNVRPWPITLAGGEPAPDFEPVDIGYITPGPRFGSKGTAGFYNPGRKIRLLATLTGHEGGVNKVRFIDGGNRLLSISDADRTVRLWDVVKGKQISMVSILNTPVGMDVTPDGSLVVVTDTYEHMVFIPLNKSSFDDPELFSTDIGGESRLAISPNGMLVATASADRLVTIWDLAARRKLTTINTPEPMRELAFSPTGDILAVSSSTNKFTLFRLEEGNGKTYTIPKVGEMSDVASIDISRDGKYLITGHMDSSITVWEVPDQKTLFNYYVNNAATWDVDFCPDGRCYATSQQDSKIYIWETTTAAKLATLEGHKGTPLSLSFNEAGTLLASGGSDKNIMIWGAALPGVTEKSHLLSFGPAPQDVEIKVETPRPERATGRASATLGLTKTEFAPAEDIIISYSAGDDFRNDAWVGIVPSSVPHGSEDENDEYDLASMLLESSLSGTLTLKAPEAPGDYDIRMFTSDDGGVEAAHLSIAVK